MSVALDFDDIDIWLMAVFCTKTSLLFLEQDIIKMTVNLVIS